MSVLVRQRRLFLEHVQLAQQLPPHTLIIMIQEGK
jgi:hypothetical protein